MTATSALLDLMASGVCRAEDLHAAAGAPDVDWPKVLRSLAGYDGDGWVRWIVRHGPDAAIGAALSLADDAEAAHIARVAVMSGRVGPLRLAALAESPSLEMRLAVAQSPRAPNFILRRIAEYDASRTARMVAIEELGRRGRQDLVREAVEGFRRHRKRNPRRTVRSPWVE